jgi:NADPH-ferrihemoprotein reductase
MIIGRKDIDYKAEVAYPRRTVLDLILQHGRRLSLEDLLFQVVPMKPRYYSIASSNMKHPNEIRLVYRRVKVSWIYDSTLLYPFNESQ